MGVPSAVGVGGASAVRVGLGVGVGIKVSGGVTVSVGSTGVISARRWGPAQDTSPAPSAARNPFWRNFLLVSFLFIAFRACKSKEACPSAGCFLLSRQASPSSSWFHLPQVGDYR